MQNLRIKLELRCKIVHASNMYFLVHTARSSTADVKFTDIMILVYHIILYYDILCAFGVCGLIVEHFKSIVITEDSLFHLW